MPVARTFAVALIGLEGSIIEVEADITAQLPAFVIIGLPDTALGEARDRVRSAAINAGCPLPQRRLTVNLSPAALPKHGSGFDLAIAVACLAAAEQISLSSVSQVVHLGELGLDGRLRPIDGILPSVLAAARAGKEIVMVPSANVAEAELVPGITVVGVASILDAAIWHGGSFEARDIDPISITPRVPKQEAEHGDLSDIVGNDEAVEALQVAAAGGHHLFLLGPPGAGKTMLASRLPGLLPDLSPEAALEVGSLRSLSGEHPGGVLSTRPPFESPHHTATAAAMVGGGSRLIRPGAVARASHGVLLLDEAPEFSSHVLDVLRQPLESGTITIHRANAIASFPARVQLVLAANPCPCGGSTSNTVSCSCTPIARRRYLNRLSGPLLDRIDLRLWVPRITSAGLRVAGDKPGMTSTIAKQRILSARKRAARRLEGTGWNTNSETTGAWIRHNTALKPGTAATSAIDRALERGSITMRGYDRLLKVAWTLADLDNAELPTMEHVGKALFLRKGITP